MADTYLKDVESLEYFDPVRVLVKYRELELDFSESILPLSVKTLRAPSLKAAREGREAALFAYGLRSVLNTKVLLAPVEDADYDFVLCWRHDDRLEFCPVQLKELVSAERNPKASLQALLDRARRRPQTGTVLLIRINRKEDIDLSKLSLHEFPFREVWFLWQSSPDGSQWSIVGDARSVPERYDFTYPDRSLLEQQ